MLRSSQYIYRSRCLGAWQYLAILPFSELHINTVWKLYHLLTVGFTKEAIENVTQGTWPIHFTFFFSYSGSCAVCASSSYISLLDYKAIVSAADFLDKFNDTVIDVPAEDMYYLLQTFASMAMARPWSDCDFVYCVTTDLFKVRYVGAFSHIISIHCQLVELVSDRFSQCHHQRQLL